MGSFIKTFVAVPVLLAIVAMAYNLSAEEISAFDP